MELFVLFLAIVIGYVIGWHHHAFTMIRRMIEHPRAYEELIKKIKEADSEFEIEKELEPRPKIRSEFLEGQYYLWEGETFLAQGPTVLEAVANAEKRFPDRKFKLRVNIPNESNQNT